MVWSPPISRKLFSYCRAISNIIAIFFQLTMLSVETLDYFVAIHSRHRRQTDNILWQQRNLQCNILQRAAKNGLNLAFRATRFAVNSLSHLLLLPYDNSWRICLRSFNVRATMMVISNYASDWLFGAPWDSWLHQDNAQGRSLVKRGN